jgi:hypothetical protein
MIASPVPRRYASSADDRTRRESKGQAVPDPCQRLTGHCVLAAAPRCGGRALRGGRGPFFLRDLIHDADAIYWDTDKEVLIFGKIN